MKSPARPLPRFLFVATAFLCAALLPAQPAGTGTIAGRVVNSIGGAALENARVTVTGTNREAFTDAFGEFKVDALEEGSGAHEVHVTATGYAPARLEATLGESVNLGDIRLRPL